jgi:hypothetical protein
MAEDNLADWDLDLIVTENTPMWQLGPCIHTFLSLTALSLLRKQARRTFDFRFISSLISVTLSLSVLTSQLF